MLGIDIGTTSVKAAVFDLRGRTHHAFAARVPTLRTEGDVVEQDPADWIEGIRAAIGSIGAAGLLPGIGAVGVTSQVNTHVFVDGSGRPLAPAIVWQDGRAASEAREIDARIVAEDRLRWWGAPMGIDASHALARMAWMARHRPGVWERTGAVLLPKDFVVRTLAGARVSDPMSNIGLVGPDLAYVEDLLLLLPGAAERLPRLVPAPSEAGRMSLAPGGPSVPVAVGIMDAWAGFLGVGLRAEGDAAYLSGTSEVLAAASEAATGEPGILVFPRLDELRVHAGPTQSGGASVDWFCGAFGTTPEAMAAEVEAAGPDLRAPLFLPHLAGERAPLWDPSARGAFLGLEAGMGRAALARAVLEGVSLSARLLAEALDRSTGRRIEAFLCGGGGFRSDTWNQIRADATGRVLRRAAVPDTGTLGAAALGAVAAGLQPDLPTALADLVTHDRTYEPDPRRAARYDDLFGLYRPAYEALGPISRALADRRLP
ncbi:Xylulose kinase [Rubellimicrobium mesophilum DSM 19309]|uniref:Xylulose kinase n=1 Tax=Rubellimicrobium mesophilum DSM 19309 TaxID=442562 RepID=A0A017HL75_9RHOB|nr:Xylulose kinase [Rubellimicrobium mesophilum DSM 19309]